MGYCSEYYVELQEAVRLSVSALPMIERHVIALDLICCDDNKVSGYIRNYGIVFNQNNEMK